MSSGSEVDAEEIRIRQATGADLLAISEIEKTVFDEPWSYAAFEQFVGESAFLVAEADEILGYVVADRTPNHGRDFGHIKDLAVHPEARRNGIGRRLLNHAISRLLVAGVSRIKLEVRASNRAAQRLYSDEGFTAIRRVPRYYSDGESALILVYDPID